MGSRLELHSLLTNITTNVYFQPPENFIMQYPCILYYRGSDNVRYASDNLYKRRKLYTVIVIDKNPDSSIPDQVQALPYTNFERFYTKNNLNHDVFSVYY